MFLRVSTIAGKKLKAFYALAIILVLIFSCKKKEAIGLEVQPNSQIGVVFTDTITLFTEPVLFNDSIVTSDENYFLTGAYQDPIFGNVYANAYVEFFQNQENKDVSNYTSIDSVVLNLNYIYHYGDSTEPQTVNVYELDQSSNLYKDSVYKSIETKKIPSYNSTPLNSVSNTPFEARPSTKNQSITLDNTFGTKILGEINTGLSNVDFQTKFKGLAFIPQEHDKGVVMALDLTGNGNRITIYYKKPGDAAEVRDSVVLMTNNGQARFHTITSDRGATQLSTLQTNGNFISTGIAGELYLQSGIGIRTRVRMPGLSNFKAKVGNIAINRAELLITDQNYNETDKLESQPIPLLRLLKLNSDGTIRKLLSGSNYAEFPVIADNLLGTSDPYSVRFNPPTKTFSFDISSYVHSIIHGVDDNYGIMISTPPSAMKITVNRIFVPAGNIKLKIYYTKVN